MNPKHCFLLVILKISYQLLIRLTSFHHLLTTTIFNSKIIKLNLRQYSQQKIVIYVKHQVKTQPAKNAEESFVQNVADIVESVIVICAKLMYIMTIHLKVIDVLAVLEFNYIKQFMSNLANLKTKLEQFHHLLKIIRKIMDRKNFESDKEKLDDSFKIIDQLIKQIKEKFKGMSVNRQDEFKSKKFEQDFEKLMKQYHRQLEQYEKKVDIEVKSLRKTLSNIHKKLRQSHIGNRNRNSIQESQRENIPEIQMYEVNQETLHFERMIEIKQKQILEIKDKMDTALKVQDEMSKMVVNQGEQLNEAENNIDTAQKNVKDAEEHLIQAQRQHISANKKKMCIVGIIVAVLLIILIPILIKFA